MWSQNRQAPELLGHSCADVWTKKSGVANSMFLAQRAAAAISCDKTCGADLDLSLMIADGDSLEAADPTFEAHFGVMHMWAKATWESWVPIILLQTVIRDAKKRFSNARNTWACVRGPAAVWVATAHRLGWQVNTAPHLLDDNGKVVNLTLESPCMVKGWVAEVVQRWRWKRMEAKLPRLQEEGRPGNCVWWIPIKAALKMPNTATWGPEHKGALKSAIMGRQWTQQRLHCAGLAQDSLCRLCMDMPDGGQVGTLLHRMRCPALRTFNQQHMPGCVKEVMERIGGEVSSRTLGSLTHALFPCPCPPVRDADLLDTLHWYAQLLQDAAVSCCMETHARRVTLCIHLALYAG